MSLTSFEYERSKDICQQKYVTKLHTWAAKIRLTRFPLLRACIAEFFGTLVLLIFGLGVLAQFKFHANEVFLSVSLGWGMGIIFGLFICGTMGCGMMNPSLTLAFALIGKIEWIYVIPLALCQMFGAYIGALCIYGVYMENIRLYELTITNGSMSMIATGDIFVTGPSNAGALAAFADQVLSTSILAALCCAIVDKHNFNVPRYLTPFYLGLVVYAIVGAFAVNAGAALNPARDFGPRLALLSIGYREAFTYQNYYFWVPLVAPVVGSIIGAVLYELTIGIHLRGLAEEREKEHVSVTSEIFEQ